MTPAPARRWPRLLAALALLPLTGCLVVEKKTLVLVVPPDSKEMRLLYVYEGLSCLGPGADDLAKAKAGLDALQRDDLSFFLHAPDGQPEQKDNPLLNHLRFGKLHFYVEPGRPRTLCAYREVVVPDRQALARTLNEGIGPAVFGIASNPARLKQTEAERKEALQVATAFGAGPLLKTFQTFAILAEKIDDPSWKRLAVAGLGVDLAGGLLLGKKQELHTWIAFESDAVRLSLPIMADCARKLKADPAADAFLKQARELVEPVRLEASDKGLTVVLGEKGKPIRLTYADPRRHHAPHEAALLRHAGNPEALLIDGKPAGTEALLAALIARREIGRGPATGPAPEPPKRGVDELIADLKSRDRDVRRQAAEALGRQGAAAKDAVPALLAIARDDIAKEIRAAAAAAVKQIDPEAAKSAGLP